MERSTLCLERSLKTVFALAALSAGSCVAPRPQIATRTSAAPSHRTDARDALIPIAIDTAPIPDRDTLTREALRGVPSAREDHLTARMQARSIRMPRPMAGGNARFNFDGGHRGWVTAAPSEELLTTPAFANGRVYLGGGFSSHEFYALNAYTGELEWSVGAPDGGPSAAIVEGDKVVFNTESCTIFAVNAETGEMQWHRWLGDPLMSQPAAAAGMVYSAYPANGSHSFGAFRLSDGEPVWNRPIPADVIQAPHVHGDAVFIATMDGTVTRFDRTTGRVMWSHDVGAASAPWLDGDHVLLTRRVDRDRATPGEQAIVLSARTGAITAEGDTLDAPYFAGESRDRALTRGQNGAWGTVPHGEHLGLRNVAAGWAFQGSTPAVADGRAYFAIGGEIRARDMASGRAVWRRTYADARGAQAVSPPAVVGSQLVFGTVDGQVYAVDVDTGTTIWAYDVGEPVVFQPIVANGWVYVSTSRGHVIGLEIGDAQFDGWHMWGGNAAHDGLVEHLGESDPRLLASLARPSQGTMRVARFEADDAVNHDARGTHANTTNRLRSGAAGGSSAAPSAEEREPELPLAHTTMHARVSGSVARVTVTQQFVNRFSQPIEAVYLFPLPNDSAVDAMQMHIGDRTVRARIQRRADAQRTYTQARAEGRRAALLEQQRPDLFAQRVANIQPGERIDVEIEYAQTVRYSEGSYEFVFPMVAPRRYDPSHPDPRANNDPLAPATNQPVAIAAAGESVRDAREIDASIEIDAGMPLEDIASPSHRLVVQRADANRAIIHLAADDTVANRDLVLRYRVSGSAPRAAVLPSRDAESGYVGLLVQPPEAPAANTLAPRDIVAVVDTSSSMHGRPLAQAQGVLRRVLSDLRPGDTFQLVRFADRVHALADAPLTVNPENLARGRRFVDELRATGATEMVAAIRAALEASHTDADPARVPIVLLVTDGFIGNEADVLRAIADGLGRTRIYSLGVGSAVNRFLLERAAEIGRGRAIVSTLGESPEDAAQRFARFIARPVFTDVTVDWGGLDVQDVYPQHVPDLFADRPLELHARYVRGGHATVRVRGTLAGRRYERAIDVNLPSTPGDRMHEAQKSLWARAAVQDRLRSLTFRDDPQLVDEATQLGLAHHLVTPWTSFVAVDDAPVRGAHAASSASAANESAANANAEPAQQATITPGRALPGDPEIRIAAPADARAVTVVLPFGETLSAEWEPMLGLWTARFLIPRDAPEGTHPVRVIVTLADGRMETRSIWYTVDRSAPLVRVEVVGALRAGHDVVIRATQTVTHGDRLSEGAFALRTNARPIEIVDDARRVEVRVPDGSVIALEQRSAATWEGTWHVPDALRGRAALHVVAVDLAANVREQNVAIEVLP
jgi:Ca-activated chloride channel family protein